MKSNKKKLMSQPRIDFQESRPSFPTPIDETDEADLTDIEDEGDEHKICDCLLRVSPGVVPYLSIYAKWTEDDANRTYFKPGVPVICTIVFARTESSGFLSTEYIYALKMEHDAETWMVYRKYADFQKLHGRLSLFMMVQGAPSPGPPRGSTLTGRAKRSMYDADGNELSTADDDGDGFSRRPLEPTDDVNDDMARVLAPKTRTTTSRRRAHKMPALPPKAAKFLAREEPKPLAVKLQAYVAGILHLPALRNHKETAEFLDVSRLSFVENLGHKFKEGTTVKRPGGRLDFNSIKRLLHERFSSWQQRWFIIKESYLGYLHPGTQVVREVLMFDNAFGSQVIPAPSSGADHGLLVSNLRRELLARFTTEQEAREWKTALDKVLENEGKEWKQVHRFGSTFPERKGCYAKWLIDGKDFMEHAAHMIGMAREEVFIANWFLTPEIFLKRPFTRRNDPWQLLTLLKRKAEEGVRVYILLYQEFQQMLDNGSTVAERNLMDAHPNIVVARHPTQAPSPTFWAHHEKIVVVDQSIGFAGGIDLCFGRWDDYNHRLTDKGEQSQSEQFRTERAISDLDVKFNRSREYFHGEKRAKVAPLLDDPDKGNDSGRIKRALQSLLSKPSESQSQLDEYNRMLSDAADVQEPCLESAPQGVWWVGKDYINWYLKSISGFEMPYCELIDRVRIPRTPWHDCTCVTYGAAARDLARHFIQRWNACKDEKYNDVERYSYIVPKSYENVQLPPVFQRMAYKCSVQVVRSASSWSVGISSTEESIQQAYIKIISQAKHYIYIENQFFISMIGSNYVTNSICKTLHDRIVRAHRLREKFRVFIFLPLLPAFEGELGTVGGSLLQNVLYFTYASISKGAQALLANLQQEIGDYSNYIAFYSLRTHSVLDNQLITNVVYIHTKAIIADDNKALIGSANINDRSLSGARDSEVAFYVEDEEFDDSIMNGASYKAGRFGRSFRRQLMAEHLGLLDRSGKIMDSRLIDLDDPVCDEFWTKFRQISRNNTDIFDRVFKCYPSDHVTSWETFNSYKTAATSESLAIANRTEAEIQLTGVKGHLVDFPTKFLESADLAPVGSLIPDAAQYPFT